MFSFFFTPFALHGSHLAHWELLRTLTTLLPVAEHGARSTVASVVLYPLKQKVTKGGHGLSN
jgi:hypothetical protein